MERADSGVEYQRFRDAVAAVHDHACKAIQALFSAIVFGLATLLFSTGNVLVTFHDEVMGASTGDEAQGAPVLHKQRRAAIETDHQRGVEPAM
jgi:hypothetical protein